MRNCVLLGTLLLTACGGPTRGRAQVFPDGTIEATPSCQPAGGSAPVAAPVFVRNLPAGETGWFSSPAVLDLDGDGQKEIVAPLYSTFVFSADGRQLAKGTATKDRVYAPGSSPTSTATGSWRSSWGAARGRWRPTSTSTVSSP